ncbi:MAG: cbb3-type cytochrome c oxidase subunit I, partial [bacterium]
GLAGEAIANASGRGLLGRSAMRVSSLTLAVAGLLGWLAQVTPAGAAHARELLPVAGVLMALSIATAVSSWVATLWGRPLTAGPALSFALGLVVLVATGMFSALPLALQPEAARQVGTYFGVAHAHEMLFGGVVMGLVAGLYLHLPKVTGRAFDPALGQLHFALTLVGAVVTFLPMHVLGLVGMPRRIHTYLPGMGWDTLNAVATAGVMVMVLAGVVFAVAIARARPAGNAPSTAEHGRTPGPALLAAGLVLLACGTLLGWTVGLVGLVVTVIGAVRAGVVRD